MYIMAEIINLRERIKKAPDNLIISKPLEFRKADWDNSFFLQMRKSQAEMFEVHRNEIYREVKKSIYSLPVHFVLKGEMSHTIKSIYINRDNKEKMIEIYYLAGLIDCMVNQVSPLLRTDLIKEIYKKISTLKSVLCVNWYGNIDQVLFPIDSEFFNMRVYRTNLEQADTVKRLYGIIRQGTLEMFKTLSREYVFYTPGRGG